MGTEDESTLTLQGRATAAAGAALVAACIVNPLDVIKVSVCWACMHSLMHAPAFPARLSPTQLLLYCSVSAASVVPPADAHPGPGHG